jgi:hypothetical protein
MIINNNIKAGQRYSNATRHQIVEVIQVVNHLIWYRIIEQDSEIRRKEVSKEISHFLNSYNLVKP